MISVVMNAYNCEKYIKEVLDAIIGQTIIPHEIIIVNDGSTDKTLQILKEYPKTLKRESKNRFVLVEKYRIINQENKGIAASANRAIKEAKGKFIVFIESDAVVEPKFIEKSIKYLESNKKIGVVAGYIKTANPEKFWARMMGYDLEYRYDHIKKGEKAVEVQHLSPNNTVYRREVFDKVKYFDESYNYCQDVEFSYRVKREGFKMVLLKNTGCKHYWKETFFEFTKQQFNVAYGRLKFLKTHPAKRKGDEVAGWRMFMQVPLTGLIIIAAIGSFAFPIIWPVPVLLLILLLIERYEEALYLLKKKKDASVLLMPFIHVWRNIVWGSAVLYSIVKR